MMKAPSTLGFSILAPLSVLTLSHVGKVFLVDYGKTKYQFKFWFPTPLPFSCPLLLASFLFYTSSGQKVCSLFHLSMVFPFLMTVSLLLMPFRTWLNCLVLGHLIGSFPLNCNSSALQNPCSFLSWGILVISLVSLLTSYRCRLL